jgi:hypothetical protein
MMALGTGQHFMKRRYHRVAIPVRHRIVLQVLRMRLLAFH